ncbi:hypothetical protein BJ912DRAFT_926773 [Pholiota molesta]|nr:hypothetical protein BJ912DRAFT_926773 [Pholiota molesta]
MSELDLPADFYKICKGNPTGWSLRFIMLMCQQAHTWLLRYHEDKADLENTTRELFHAPLLTSDEKEKRLDEARALIHPDMTFDKFAQAIANVGFCIDMHRMLFSKRAHHFIPTPDQLVETCKKFDLGCIAAIHTLIWLADKGTGTGRCLPHGDADTNPPLRDWTAAHTAAQGDPGSEERHVRWVRFNRGRRHTHKTLALADNGTLPDIPIIVEEGAGEEDPIVVD